jgi:hypothetical protein
MLPPLHDVIPQPAQGILFGRGAKLLLRLLDAGRQRKAPQVFEVVKLLPGPGTALLAVAPADLGRVSYVFAEVCRSPTAWPCKHRPAKRRGLVGSEIS